MVTAQGNAQQGAQLLSAAEALREASGAVWWPADRVEYEHSLALLQQSLGEATLAATWASVQAQPFDAVVQKALALGCELCDR